jgi:5-methylcytosine-specific restriction endonuclease McrA
MGSRESAIGRAARRAGVDVLEYRTRILMGEKWCYACRAWLPADEFGVDRSRWDGRAAMCMECRRPSASGPSRRQRLAKAKDGLTWCRRCEEWRPGKRGLCREHAAAEERERYGSDPSFRNSVKHRVALRRRGVGAVPPEGEESLTEEFEGLCAYCPAPADTWDHVVPVADGGKTTPGNIVPACRSCNSSKHARPLAEWLSETGREPHPALEGRLLLAHAGLFG